MAESRIGPIAPFLESSILGGSTVAVRCATQSRDRFELLPLLRIFLVSMRCNLCCFFNFLFKK